MPRMTDPAAPQAAVAFPPQATVLLAPRAAPRVTISQCPPRGRARRPRAVPYAPAIRVRGTRSCSPAVSPAWPACSGAWSSGAGPGRPSRSRGRWPAGTGVRDG